MSLPTPAPLQKYLNGLLIILVVGCTAIGYGAWQYERRAKAEQAAHDLGIQAASAREYIVELEDRVRDGDKKLADAKVSYQASLDNLKAHPKPPPVGKPPETAPEVQNGLLDLGLKPGLVVLADPFQGSKMALSDAQTAWTWGKEAKRVPVLEDRVSALEFSLKKCDDLNFENAEQLKLRDTMIEVVKKESNLNRGQAEELGKAVVAEKKRSKVQKWLWGAAGLGIGWLARGK